jgi:hypothetical protein
VRVKEKTVVAEEEAQQRVVLDARRRHELQLRDERRLREDAAAQLV